PRGETGDLADVLQVPDSLKVAGIVPAGVGARVGVMVDEKRHGLNPFGVGERLKPPLKGTLHVPETVAVAHGVAHGADTALHVPQVLACLAVPGRERVAVAWHLVRLGQAADQLPGVLHRPSLRSWLGSKRHRTTSASEVA